MSAAKPRTSTGIRFKPELHERLVAESERLDLPVNWLVNRAVEYMLDNLEVTPMSLAVREALP